MTAPQRSSEDDARLDALRRRLYRPEATDADRQRYAAASAAAVLESEPDAATADRPPEEAARRPRWGAVVVAVALAGLAGVGIGQHLAPRAAETARPSAAPVLRQDFEDAPTFAVHMRGVSGPVSVATSIRGTPVLGQQFEGRGRAVVPVDLLPGSFDGGRAMVVLTAAQPTPTAWEALGLVNGNDVSAFPVVMARGTADPGRIVATPSMFVYPGAAPGRIAVEAPDDVRWTLVVAATPQIADQLH